jgi:hypothetical protein
MEKDGKQKSTFGYFTKNKKKVKKNYFDGFQ